MQHDIRRCLTALLTALALALLMTAGAAADPPATESMAVKSKETLPEIDRELRSAAAARLATAARGFGLEIDRSTVAYASSRELTVAGARVNGNPTFRDLLAGKPLALWFVAASKESGLAAGFYTASLSRRSASSSGHK